MKLEICNQNQGMSSGDEDYPDLNYGIEGETKKSFKKSNETESGKYKNRFYCIFHKKLISIIRSTHRIFK